MRTRRTGALAAMAVLAAVGLAGAPSAGPVVPLPEDAQWLEEWFPLGDGLVELHADVLRSDEVAFDVPQPVVLTVGPFFGHQGETTDYGGTGPSGRFHDFLEVTDLFDRGWTYVMVDLPGFGGSNGCIDWGGDVDRAAVAAAVEWVAEQPWSTGSVALMGSAWDGWTAMMGLDVAPEPLRAVVAMEPLYSGYRYQFTNGLRIAHSAYAMPVVNAYDAVPGPYQEPDYTRRGAPTPYCYAENVASSLQDRESTAYWAERNLLEDLDGSKVPLLLMQGFLETSTNVDGAFEAFDLLDDADDVGWFGQFDTGRGWETVGDVHGIGRPDFVDVMLDFLDQHVVGLPPSRAGRAAGGGVEAQDNLGRWRSEAAWPPADALAFATDLRPGTYLDDGENRAAGRDAGNGTWSVSPPLPHDVWMVGEPTLTASIDAMPGANLVANVYDVDEDGTATLVNRGGMLLREAGVQDVEFTMYGQDWVFAAGHRIGVLVSSANADWWLHVPTNTAVELRSGQVALPFLTRARTSFLPDGEAGPDLLAHLATQRLDLDAATIERATTPFALPDDLGPLTDG